MPDSAAREETNMYARNSELSILTIDRLDDTTRALLMSFFRRIGVAHVYWERVEPSFQKGESLVVASVLARPWPPSGMGRQRITALSHAYHMTDRRAYLSALWSGPDELTNLGLMSTVYKEMLEHLVKRGIEQVTYVVHEGSIWARHVLETNRFDRTDEPYFTEDGRYIAYRANPKELLDYLGIAGMASEDLLALRINESVLDRLGMFHGTLQLATRSQPHEVLSKPDGGPPHGS